MPTFTSLDYTVIAAYLGGILLLGAWFSFRQNSLEEYFHAQASIPWWAIGISLLATSLSPITYLDGPGWVFEKDSRGSVQTLVLGAFVMIPLAAAIWVPLWGRIRVLSIYEYLERRFHWSIRSLGAFLFILNSVFWIGTALVTAGLGFEKVTGFDGRMCLVIMAFLGTAYTALGGIRAVIWTDVAQFVVFILGYVSILVVLLSKFDWQPMEIFRIASETVSETTGYPHTQVVSFEWDLSIEATFWAVLFLRFIGALQYGTDQNHVQRLHVASSPWQMVKSMMGSYAAIILFSCVSIPAAWGFVAFGAKNPEWKATIDHPDQILPAFAVTFLPPVFRSLIMAGVLAALMSSLDSILNSLSSVTISDFYRRYWRPQASEKQLVNAAKIMTVAFGLLLMAFGLWQFDRQGDVALEKLTKLTNLVMAPMASFFLLGMFSRRANTPGAFMGALAGIAFGLVFNGFPGLMEPQVQGINWMWVGGLATLFNVAVGYCASYLFKAPPSESLEGTTWWGGEQQS